MFLNLSRKTCCWKVFPDGIFLLPVLIDGAGNTHEPVAVFHEF